MNEELECAAYSHPHHPFTTDSIDYSTLSTTFQQSHRHKLPTNSTRDTCLKVTPPTTGHLTEKAKNKCKATSHTSRPIIGHTRSAPNTTPPGVLTPNSRTYTMQEASGRERFSGKNLNKCPQKIPNNSPPREQSIPLTL